MWYQGDEDEDEDLMCSPAILARRASESWINVPPVEVKQNKQLFYFSGLEFFWRSLRIYIIFLRFRVKIIR